MEQRPAEEVVKRGSASTSFPIDAWPAARKAALVRDGHRCQRCGAVNRSELDVHHRMPRSIKVDHSAANLITLCDGCHASLHLNLQVGLARRVIQRWAVRVARLIDLHGELPKTNLDLGPVLQVLGKTKLRDGQLPVILAILAGKNVLAVRPTGSGKSLCFQVPILLSPGTGLVIEPLKALMKDQVQGLHSLRLPATFISSDVPLGERRQRYDLLEQGTWKFIYMAPERFDPNVIRDTSEYDRLIRFRPNYLVIDEAHTVSQYGDGFRPIYAELARIRELVGSPPVLAFTATASPEMQLRVCESLGIPDATIIVENPDRANIALVRLAYSKDDPRRIEIIMRLLAKLTTGRAIIFVPTVKEGERLQRELRLHGVDLEFFHSKARTRPGATTFKGGSMAGSFQRSMRSSLPVRSAWGLTYQTSASLCTGSTRSPLRSTSKASVARGRDGKRWLAVLFTDERQDSKLLNYMVDKDDTPTRAQRLDDIAEMAELANTTNWCFRESLVTHLVGDTKPRRSWAMRILNWAFGEKMDIEHSQGCCDHCSPSLPADVAQGRIQL